MIRTRNICSKLVGRESILGQPKPNGYSIAEILLVFGIIAGVLIGVWAMYTMLGDKSDAQTAIAEIQMLREAAVEYKHAQGQRRKHTYSGISGMSDLKPYLGRQSGLADGNNIFGATIDVTPTPNGRDLVIMYEGVQDIEVCRQILNNFGTVTNGTAVYDDSYDGMIDRSSAVLTVKPGDAIPGYLGSSNLHHIGCEQRNGTGEYILYVLID